MTAVKKLQNGNHTNIEPETVYTKRLIWRNVFLLLFLHILAICAVFFVFSVKIETWLFVLPYGYISALGVTAGAHRLWCHKTYKARLPLRIFLVFCNLTAIQTDIWNWSRDHRVHHKFTDTDADPHNSKRGFFFSHMGWLFWNKHPDVYSKGKLVDMSDLENDKVVMFERKYYIPLSFLFGVAMPVAIPVYFWTESIVGSFMITFVLRYVAILHATWSVNSVAHIWGDRPYDSTISPRENKFVSLFTFGEGFHNYHHAFPWDYATSEWGIKMNGTTAFINVMWYLGLAYDLKSASKGMIDNRLKRTGKLH